MAQIVGRRKWEGSADENGDRDYQITWRIRTSRDEGPQAVMDCPGLPTPGAPWSFDDDSDETAWCRPKMTVKPIVSVERDPCELWDLTQTFSNKPPPEGQRQGCQDEKIDDPLLEPQQVSGTFVKYTEEATYDRFGIPIMTSSFEQIRGPQNEWDANRPSVTIKQNVAVLGLEIFAPMIDNVNILPLWGLPARCVKLSNVEWEKKFYGLCYVYYTRTLHFDVNYQTFDRDVLDEGTKCLNGHWDPDSGAWVLDAIDDEGTIPDAGNPSHFTRFKDRNGENCRVVLNGSGLPSGVDVDIDGTGTAADIPSGDPGSIHIEKYFEADFLALGIPTTF